MDTTINLETYKGNKEADSYLKITEAKLYRINGTSAQVTGVIPDIELPDLSSESAERESEEKNAIRISNIEANKYYKPLAPLPIASAEKVKEKELDSSAFFKEVIRYNKWSEDEKKKKDESLMIEDVLKQIKTKTSFVLPGKTDKSQNAPFTATNNSYEERRQQTDELLKKTNNEWKERLVEDPYIRVAYSLLAVMNN